MNKDLQKSRFICIAFDLIVLYSLFELIKFFVPGIVLKVTYTYGVYYRTTHECFPHYTNIAFAVIILLPHLLLILLFVILYRRVAARTQLRERIYNLLWWLAANIWKLTGGAVLIGGGALKKVLNIVANGKYFKVLTRGTLHPNVWKQWLLSAFITLVFAVFYYWLQEAIPDKGKFFHAQLTLSHWFLLTLFLQLTIAVYASRKNFLPFFKSWFSEPGSAYNLALFRILIGINLWGIYFNEQANNSYWSALPKQMRVSLPLMGWFIQNIPISPAIYHATALLGMICAGCIAFGFCTRIALVLNIPLSIYIIGVPFFFGKLFHMHIWVWFPAILAFSDCGDVISVDRLIKKLRGKSEPITLHPKYRLPLSLVWMHLGIIYFFAGVVKMKDCGFAWALSDSMINQIYLEWAQWYNRVPSIRVDHYPLLLHVSGMAVILFEIFYIFLIFSPLGRVFAFFGGLAMHNIINYMMYISFLDLQMMYASFVNWQKALDWFKRIFLKLNPPPAVTLEMNELLRIKTYKQVFFTGMVLLTINFACGVFRIKSWPFSSYPTYSAIVPDYRHYVYFKTYDRQGNPMVVYDLGKAAHFRMESFTTIEDRINENMNAGDSVSLNRNIRKLWDIWLANVPALKSADTVAVYMRTSSIIPGKTDSIMDEKYLMSMKF